MKRAPRFALDSPPDGAGTARVSRAQAHHMRDVMRLDAGSSVTLIDDTGVEYAATIESYDRAGATLRIISASQARKAAPLILAQAIIKGPRMDFIVEKAAEIGATELWPIISARALVHTPGAERLARWNRLAIAAARQSFAMPPMKVGAAMDFTSMLKTAAKAGLAVICTAGAEPLEQVIAQRAGRGILIACGPEGDFSGDEINAARACGFVPAGLGPNRLRSETAALAALVIAAALGRDPAERLHRRTE